MSNASIVFPHLGITLENVGRNLNIGGFEIAYYGIVIAAGMLLALELIMALAKKSGQSDDDYLTMCMVTIFGSVIGARLYYVIFNWDYYRTNLMEILNIRGGGLAIYGGILTGIIILAVFAKWKRYPLLQILDTCVPGLAFGQAIGRWGNFFNREAFGRYTDSLFAMALPKAAVYPQDITAEMLSHLKKVGEIEFIQVHPTFLYESLWNLGLLTTLLIVYSKKKFHGQIFAIYLGVYGIGRFFIESIRTDQLLIKGTGIPISMVVSILFVITAVLIAVLKRKPEKNRKNQI